MAIVIVAIIIAINFYLLVLEKNWWIGDGYISAQPIGEGSGGFYSKFYAFLV